MELVLTAIAAPAGTGIAAGQTQVFPGVGGTLGRAADNSWVLPDPDRVVSSHHATINCQDGRYQLIDHSTNGTFVNDTGAPLGQGNSTLLNEGDRVFIGGFQFQVGLRQPAPAGPAPGLGSSFLDNLGATTSGSVPLTAHSPLPVAGSSDGPAELDDLDKWLEPAGPADTGSSWSGAAPPGGAEAMSFTDASANTDPLALLGAGSQPPQNPWLTTGPSTPQGADDGWWQDSQSDHAPVEQQQLRIPTPREAGEAVNIDDLLGLPPETRPPATAAESAWTQADTQPGHLLKPPQEDITERPPSTQAVAQTTPPPPVQQPQPAAATASTNTLDQSRPAPGSAGDRLASQLGLQRIAEDQHDALTDTVAAVVRQTAERLIDILRARSSIKNELRLERTMISANENNPLKFSPRAEEAIGYMFEDRGGAFLQGETAIRDSFDDLADHQVAVLAGMRAAYEAMLAEFDPARLEQRLDTGGSLLGNRNAKRWEAYQQYYARLEKDPENSYSKLFGETFARAYENQINELKAARHFSRSR